MPGFESLFKLCFYFDDEDKVVECLAGEEFIDICLSDLDGMVPIYRDESCVVEMTIWCKGGGDVGCFGMTRGVHDVGGVGYFAMTMAVLCFRDVMTVKVCTGCLGMTVRVFVSDEGFCL